MSGGMIGGGGTDPPTTTKGDVSGFDTTFARIPIGTNNQVLTADSAQALGLKWATPSGAPTTTKGDLSGFSTTQSRIPIGTNNQVLIADSTEALGLKWADNVPTPAWSRIVYQQQTGGSANFNVTGLTSTAQYMMFTFAGDFGGNDKLRIRFGTGGSIDTGSSYKWASATMGSSYSGSTSTSDTSITVNSGNFETDRRFLVSGFMQWNAPTDGAGTADSRIGTFTTTGLANGYQTFQTGFEYLESATPITDVRFYANGGNDIRGTLAMYESQ
jgi:hypothetical protein